MEGAAQANEIGKVAVAVVVVGDASEPYTWRVEMGADVVGGSTWGTWLELLLAGAVLRYGTRDWNLVAAELRARTVCPYAFTPQVCKAKYEDLQKCYSGCK